MHHRELLTNQVPTCSDSMNTFSNIYSVNCKKTVLWLSVMIFQLYFIIGSEKVLDYNNTNKQEPHRQAIVYVHREVKGRNGNVFV